MNVSTADLEAPVSGLGRVFVLDDDAACLRAACAALTAAGFAAEGFQRPDAFFAAFDDGLPVAVVLERRLRGASGDMVTARLRAHLGPRRPAVVLWTADERRDTEATLLSGLADDLVLKGQQGVAILVKRVINRAGWDHVGPGLFCRREEGVLLYKGQRSDPLTPRELDLVYRLVAQEGVTPAQAALLTLPLDHRATTRVHTNVVLSRLRRKLPAPLRAALLNTRSHGWRFDLTRHPENDNTPCN